ncbi:HamA C-terminal domain-containing protein [Corynebacterium cystitidis]|uniref:HamA C-terminal domain-containing protein n=1 Tax=Corynebacterium cystitidis TaxID=35757 RepID=UPI00211EA1AA|nr:DUF1837 domain-containing protein [Corynebacterium cystitidis]
MIDTGASLGNIQADNAVPDQGAEEVKSLEPELASEQVVPGGSSSSYIEKALPFTLEDRQGFVDLFYEPVNFELNLRSNLNLSVLKIENGDFVLDKLYTALSEASIGYVLSRVETEKLRKTAERSLQKMMAAMEDVKAKFQQPNSTVGEGGELLLYALLEAGLGAPKLLSKMEIKSSRQMPVFGADGVHLLEVEEGEYQLIFGESKMYKDLGGAIKAAFKSIHEVREAGFQEDLSLVSTQVMKEAVSEGQLDALEAILLPPSEGGADIKLVNSFGILLAFNLDVTKVDIANLPDEEIEKEYQRLAEQAINLKIKTIEGQIEYYDLGATTIHIFGVPFLKRTKAGRDHDIEDVRRELQERLVFGKNASKKNAA